MMNDATRGTRLTPRAMAAAALFAALTGVAAQIRIPFPLIPMTLQTLMVILAGLVLGARTGALSMLLYLFIGLVGLPVFAGGGGPQTILHPTFGFLVGFIPAAWVSGWLIERLDSPGGKLPPPAANAVASLAGVAVYDTFGLVGLYLNLNYIVGKSVTLAEAAAIGVIPFILPDLVKTAGTVAIASIVRNRFR